MFPPTTTLTCGTSCSASATKLEFTARDTVALAQNRLAAGIYLTSFGLPFMQAGEEFARTKKGVSNSYRSSPPP